MIAPDVLLDRLRPVEDRFHETEKLLSDPEVISDSVRFRALMREHGRLQPAAAASAALRAALEEEGNAREWLATGDAEVRAWVRSEWDRIEADLAQAVELARIALLPKDEADDRSVVLEVRAGTGGDEAALFAGDLFRMYCRFADERGWHWELVSASEGAVGGFKEVIARIEGDGVYGALKFESGVHRVQRVPETESQGRIHTSAATVAVLPVAEEVDVVLNLADVRRDTYRSSGAGGQHVNKTESAVRLTHLPTGVVVECQEGRSQHANYDRALEVLRSRLFDLARAAQRNAEAATRKTLVSTGDRSAKIRTYHFPQGRVTDHRIGWTSHALGAVLGGDLGPLLAALQAAEQAELLAYG